MDDQNEKVCNNILIVEDEKGIQEVLKDALEMEGYTVFTADNGQEGLEMLPKMPTPCLILLDLMMPVMNGWQFAEVISKDMTLATIPVVLVTAYGDRARSTTGMASRLPVVFETQRLWLSICGSSLGI